MAGMKCCREGCAADTLVTHTKNLKWGGIERKRTCFNGHRFTTLESVWVPMANRRTANKERNLKYVREHLQASTKEVMKALNVSASYARRLRKEEQQAP